MTTSPEPLQDKPLQDGPLRVLILVPMRNEEHFIRRCLDPIVRQLEASRHECTLICIDGASTDATRDIVMDEYVAKNRCVELIDNPACIKPVGLNLAIRQEETDVIIILDCHTEYASDYIESNLRVLERTGADVVGGYCNSHPGKPSAVGRAISDATSHRFGVGSTFRTGSTEQEVDAVPFGCFRREIFEDAGLFDERLVRNQDYELYCRIRKNGGRIVISPEIQMKYFNRSTYRGIAQQSFNNGRWNIYSTYIVGGGISIRHFIPMLFVLGLIALALLSVLWFPAVYAFAGYIGFYTSCALAASWQAATRKHALLLVCLAFWIIHLSYGMGSLWGLLTLPFRLSMKTASKGSPIHNRVD